MVPGRTPEVVYGLEGTLTMTVDGKRQEVRPGDVALIPSGSVHRHENLHEGTARVLIVLTPGSVGPRYFEEVAEAVNVPGKPDPAQVTKVMLRHGLILPDLRSRSAAPIYARVRRACHV